MLPRIFVLMASYRDSECQFTVRDLFEKASHPERVFVGICWQYDMLHGQDNHCFEHPYPYPEHVRVVAYDFRDAKGANWGRHQASLLWQGEEYVFFTEPHIRYEEGWDEILLAMHANAPSPRSVLTSIQMSYTQPNQLGRAFVASMSLRAFHTNDVVLINSHHVPDHIIPDKPFPSPVLVVSSLFGPSEFLKQVPIDPHIYFEGDESSHSVRAWTHGWDIFCMNIPLSFHLDDRSTRPLHWNDIPERSSELSNRSAERFRYLLNMEDNVSDEALTEIDIYNLGNVRSLKEYEEFAGIDFRNRIIHDQSRWIIKEDALSTPRPAPWRIQKRLMDDLRSWIQHCIESHVGRDHIINICVSRGISLQYAEDEYEKMQTAFSEQSS